MEPVQTEPTVHAADGIGGQNVRSAQRTATGALFAMGFWAVADQTLFAMSNFVLNVVLGRWLTAEEYGAFATAYAVFLLVGTGHQALILEPMLVFGSGKYKAQRSSYLQVLLSAHWLFAACASGLTITAGTALLFLQPGSLGPALVALGLCCPLILFQWLTRRMCYVTLEPQVAALAGLVYLLVQLAGAYVFFERGLLNSVSAIALMGASSTIAAVFLMWRLRIRWSLNGGAHLRQEVLVEHWGYGRWSLGASLLGWVPGNIYYLFLPAVIGLAATGALKAMTNLIMPVLHTFLALSVLLIPVLVRLRDTPGLWLMARRALVLFMAGALIYWLMLGTFSREIVDLVYNGQYGEYSPLLWLVGVVCVTGAGVAAMGSVLRALERPQHVFMAYVISAAVASSAGVGLMLSGGVWGSGLGMVLSSLATCGAMGWLLWFTPQATGSREAVLEDLSAGGSL